MHKLTLRSLIIFFYVIFRFDNKAFHQDCDKKGTISFFKDKFNYLICFFAFKFLKLVQKKIF